MSVLHARCATESIKRNTGQQYMGFVPSGNPVDPTGFKNVLWPKDVVCEVSVACNCIGAPIDPEIVIPCSDGTETPVTVVRRTVVFDPTLTCDNVDHPAYPRPVGGLPGSPGPRNANNQ